MSDYKYSIEAKNVNKIFYKNSRKVSALINFDIKIINYLVVTKRFFNIF